MVNKDEYIVKVYSISPQRLPISSVNSDFLAHRDFFIVPYKNYYLFTCWRVSCR